MRASALASRSNKAALDGEDLYPRRAPAERRLSQRDDPKVRAGATRLRRSADTSSVRPTALQCS